MSPPKQRQREQHHSAEKGYQRFSSSGTAYSQKLYPSLLTDDDEYVEEDETHSHRRNSFYSADESCRTTRGRSESNNLRRKCLNSSHRSESFDIFKIFYESLSWIKGNAGLFIVLVSVLLIFIKYFFFHSHSSLVESPISSLNRYQKNVHSLLKKKYPLENGNTRSILRLIGKKWIGEVPKEPYTVLVAGKRAKEFALDVANAVNKFVKQDEVSQINCHYGMERSELDAGIFGSLSKKKKIIILNDIDQLRGIAPLSLHSLCDYEHSPFPSALIILTVTRSNFGADKECEKKITELLLDEWTTGFLDKDKITPIFSRITSFLICLKS